MNNPITDYHVNFAKINIKHLTEWNATHPNTPNWRIIGALEVILRTHNALHNGEIVNDFSNTTCEVYFEKIVTIAKEWIKTMENPCHISKFEIE